MYKPVRYRPRPAKDTALLTEVPKRRKFDYEMMKEAAANKDPAVRKGAFIEYFEQFKEFPSFLFDNEQKIDERLLETIQDLLKDPETSEEMHKGITALLDRLPS